MKTLLQRYVLLASQKDSGFTLIELLVVIVIIGVLAAIGLPSYLNAANQARESEARNYIGSINRAQQVQLFETGSYGTLEQLNLGITDSENYSYSVTVAATEALASATPVNPTLNGFAGRTYTTVNSEGNAATSTLLCEGDVNSVPQLSGQATCPE